MARQGVSPLIVCLGAEKSRVQQASLGGSPLPSLLHVALVSPRSWNQSPQGGGLRASADLAVEFQRDTGSPLCPRLPQSCRFFMGAGHASSPVIGGAGSYLRIPAVSVFKAHADPSLRCQIYVLSPEGVTLAVGLLKDCAEWSREGGSHSPQGVWGKLGF